MSSVLNIILFLTKSSLHWWKAAPVFALIFLLLLFLTVKHGFVVGGDCDNGCMPRISPIDSVCTYRGKNCQRD